MSQLSAASERRKSRCIFPQAGSQINPEAQSEFPLTSLRSQLLVYNHLPPWINANKPPVKHPDSTNHCKRQPCWASCNNYPILQRRATHHPNSQAVSQPGSVAINVDKSHSLVNHHPKFSPKLSGPQPSLTSPASHK